MVQQLVDPPIALLNVMRLSKGLSKHMQLLAAQSCVSLCASRNFAGALPKRKVRYDELNTAGAPLACLLDCFSSAVAKKVWMLATIIRMRLSLLRWSRPTVGCLCHYLYICNATSGHLEEDGKKAEHESGAHARETMTWSGWSRDKGFSAYRWLAMLLASIWCNLVTGNKEPCSALSLFSAVSTSLPQTRKSLNWSSLPSRGRAFASA